MSKQHSGTALSEEDYINAVKLRDKLDRQIAEYEEECRRGCLKIIRVKCGVGKNADGFSIRYDARLNKSFPPYWRTITTYYTQEEVLEFLRVMARDFQAEFDAFREKMEEDHTNE